MQPPLSVHNHHYLCTITSICAQPSAPVCKHQYLHANFTVVCVCSNCFCMVHDEYKRTLTHENSSRKNKRPLKLCSRGLAITTCHTCEHQSHPATGAKRANTKHPTKKKTAKPKRKEASSEVEGYNNDNDDDFKDWAMCSSPRDQ